jgi:hypothetical protein
MEGGAGAGSRTTRFMMEGVGARVIRGPDWKWGKQVISYKILFWSYWDLCISFLVCICVCAVLTFIHIFRMEGKVMLVL